MRLVVIVVTLAVCTNGEDAIRTSSLQLEKQRSKSLLMGSRGANPPFVTPEQQNNTEVIAQVGGTATLKCYTHFLGNDLVTWMKRDNDLLLTVGEELYSSETRYSIAYVQHLQLWALTVRGAKVSDGGSYECQLTSHPPVSLFFTLKVVEARAILSGSPSLRVNMGSGLQLLCRVVGAPSPPAHFLWSHNGTVVSQGTGRPLRIVSRGYASTLIAEGVTQRDAGSYKCHPHLARPDNLTLHVVEGERPAALHGSREDLPEGDSAHLLPTLALIGYCLAAAVTSWAVIGQS